MMAVHYDGGTLACRMYDNARAGLPLVSPEYQDCIGFFDMECIYQNPPIYIAQQYYRLLKEQNPDALFILNTRNKIPWIESRKKHVDMANGIKYVDALCENYGGITPAQLYDK